MANEEHFTLAFDPNPSCMYPAGYWHAKSARGDFDATGSTPVDALASLVIVLDEARLKAKEARAK